MKKILLNMIDFYQRKISPNTKKHCKYYPSCSEYTKKAIEKYGAFRGLGKGIWRILRCNPFSKGGYDPIK